MGPVWQIGAAGLLCLVTWAMSESRPAVSSRPVWSGPAFPIQSHRGAGNLAPENTLPTFELAWKLGTIPEADVRASRDGVIVAFHDENFKRLVKDVPQELAGKSVAELTWDELARLDVGSWKGEAFRGQRIARIADAFALMRHKPERMLYLDVKVVPLERLAALAKEHGVQRQVILASTRDPEIRRWRELLPSSQTLLWMGGTESVLSKRLSDLRANGFAGVTQLQVHVKVGKGAGEPFSPSPAFIERVGVELRERGILFQVLPLGSNDPAVYRRLLELGVQSFATDDPEITLSAVRKFAEGKRG